MRIVVTSAVVFDVPAGSTLEAIEARLRAAHVLLIGTPMETITGQRYTLIAIEQLRVELLDV